MCAIVRSLYMAVAMMPDDTPYHVPKPSDYNSSEEEKRSTYKRVANGVDSFYDRAIVS
jgi:hypothetical protein